MSGSKGIHSSVTSPFAGTQLFATPVKRAVDATTVRSASDPYFRIVASAPALDPREIDSAVAAVEVTVSWGEHDILDVAHLAPPRAFVVGERNAPSEGDVDFELARAFLGRDRLAIVEPCGTGVMVRVPADARLAVLDGSGVREHEAMLGSLVPAADEREVSAYVLREGETARLAWKGFVFRIRGVAAAKPVIASRRPELMPFAVAAGLGAVVAAAFGIGSLLMPDRSMLGGETLSLDDRYVAALIEAREQARSQVQADAPAPSDPAGPSASGDTGQAGDLRHRDRSGALAQQGEADPSDAQLATTTIDAESGSVSSPVLDAMATLVAAFDAPTSAYGRNAAVGADSLSMIGQLIGGPIGAGSGLGGLGMVGSGLGSGGDGSGTIGNRDGDGGIGLAPRPDHYGDCRSGQCDVMSTRQAAVPRVPVPQVEEPSGGLSADAIRRVVARNISQVRHCYEQGLQRDPSLAGRVTVAFIIGPNGAVLSSRADASGIADPGVAGCVGSSVRRWSFPQPEGGRTVSVRFPFTLSRAAQ